MLFSSLEFVFLFLPVALIAYYATPRKLKNLTLFLLSILFYAFGEILLLPIFLLTVFASYGFGIIIGKLKKGSVQRRIALIVAIGFDLAFLIYFKYFDFLREAIFGVEPLGILLPIGISFYTFQAISYEIDVYRGDVAYTKNFINFGTYISLFPQLIAGPIVKYSDVEAELLNREHSISKAADGIRIFVCGYAKKAVLANSAGAAFESFCDSESYLSAILCIFFFGMQIYFDFSAYSDMAIGLGRAFGFELPKNFDYPYISRSVSEFWRRWHITLSSFFREYVYIPLGGSRVSKMRLVFNLLTVWALTGIWHGAAWNFLLWGAYFAVLLIAEKLLLGRFLEKLPSFLTRIYSLFFIFLGWLIFATDGVTLSAKQGLSLLSRLFFVGAESFVLESELYLLVGLLPFIVILCVGSTPLVRRAYAFLSGKCGALSALLPIVGLIISVAYTAGAGYNPFLYFRF